MLLTRHRTPLLATPRLLNGLQIPVATDDLLNGWPRRRLQARPGGGEVAEGLPGRAGGAGRKFGLGLNLDGLAAAAYRSGAESRAVAAVPAGGQQGQEAGLKRSKCLRAEAEIAASVALPVTPAARRCVTRR